MSERAVDALRSAFRTGSVRSLFLAQHAFALDRFQERALDILDEGHSVLVAAPTGSGKTLVAEYAVARALAAGRRAFYTAPIKALSNQKYLDLAAVYGSSSVGLLTGDVSRNPEAAVVVMTTEVLRNMIYSGSARLADLGCVVLDEVHYLEDPYRGSVWEEIIITAPADVALVCLSATVSNAEELARWIEGVRGSTGVVIEERRPIPIEHRFCVGDRVEHDVLLLDTFVDGRPNPAGLAADRREAAQARPVRQRGRARSRTRAFRPRRHEVVSLLSGERLLPAIYFIFARAACDDAARQCVEAGLRLTTSEERAEIREIADRYVDGLSDADLRVLGYAQFRELLEQGFAPHHAGLVPPFREAVEALFSRALCKVVFATETLALGINMPARSVVIESLSRFTGATHEDLTPGAYTQLVGRAGRRGIDDVGFGVVVYSPFHRFEDVAKLAGARSRPLGSAFRPTYNMVVNLARRYDRDEARRLVRSSFAQYLSEVPLTRQLDAVVELLGDRHYLAGWSLTDDGVRLAGIYHECDLLIAEAMRTGLLDGLGPAELAGFVSAFTYEARRDAATEEPSALLAERFALLEELADALRSDERARRLPPTRALDAGFAALVAQWADGTPFGQVITPRRRRRGPQGAAPMMSGGDFVRNVKQVVDLLRQISITPGDHAYADTAARAAGALVRGVVAESTGVNAADAAELVDDPPSPLSRPLS